MNNTSKTALSALSVAMGTVFMFLSSAIPTLEYAVPAAAGFVVLFVQAEINKSWAAGVYAATSLLGVLLVPNKEAMGMYIALFGLYPLLKSFFDKLPKAISYVVKSLFFVTVTLGAYFIMIKLFGVAAEILEDLNKITLPILVLAGLVAFIIYDRAMMLIERLYINRYHKYVARPFKRK